MIDVTHFLHNILLLARVTALRPVTTLLGAFRHTWLHLVGPYCELARLCLARFCIEKKKSRMPPNSADIYFFFQTHQFKAKKIFMEGFTFHSRQLFILLYGAQFFLPLMRDNCHLFLRFLLQNFYSPMWCSRTPMWCLST